MTLPLSEPANPLRRLALAVIDPPRELWKRLVNLTRGVRDISPRQAEALIRDQNAFVLDVREPQEFAAGHVKNSRLIPLGTLSARVQELEPYRARPIVVICHGGKRSATACALLARQGFENTFNIAGGILAWKKQALPVVQ